MISGRFITLEGGEGTGKSTLIAGLSKMLRDRGIACIITREPGGTALAEKIRGLVLNPPSGEALSALAQALLMNAAREDHLERQIRPALRAGRWVICDRFADSTRAYQSIEGAPMSTLLSLEAAVLADTRPDLTFVLDADPVLLQERRALRGVTDAFEAKDTAFHSRIREVFLSIAAAEPERCHVINALADIDDVQREALAVIEKRLGLP